LNRGSVLTSVQVR